MPLIFSSPCWRFFLFWNIILYNINKPRLVWAKIKQLKKAKGNFKTLFRERSVKRHQSKRAIKSKYQRTFTMTLNIIYYDSTRWGHLIDTQGSRRIPTKSPGIWATQSTVANPPKSNQQRKSNSSITQAHDTDTDHQRHPYWQHLHHHYYQSPNGPE